MTDTSETTPDTSGIPAPVDIYGPQPAAYRAMLRLEQAARDGVGDDTIFELVKLRASQINGCGYCIDMHSKDLLAAGETPQRLVLLDAWREAPVYTRAERAALALTEAVTTVADGHPSPEVEAEAREVFDEGGYAGLVVAIALVVTGSAVVMLTSGTAAADAAAASARQPRGARLTLGVSACPCPRRPSRRSAHP